MEGFSEEFSGTWPSWGTAYRGECFELPTPERPTSERGSSSSLESLPIPVQAEAWRTPSAGDAEGGLMEMRDGANGKYKLRDHSVAAVFSPTEADMWRTPMAQDAGSCVVELKEMQSRTYKLRVHSVVATETMDEGSLQDPDLGFLEAYEESGDLEGAISEAVSRLFGPNARQRLLGDEFSEIGHTSRLPSPKRRRLNKRFVEWLMGFPEGWTDLPSEDKPSKPSGTP
jgi:hypothetical protein